MYPGYQLRDVLELPAISFFALLNEGLRQRHRHYQVLAQIADLPHLKKEDRQKFYSNLRWSAADVDDILKPSSEGSSPAEIKRLLRG